MQTKIEDRRRFDDWEKRRVEDARQMGISRSGETRQTRSKKDEGGDTALYQRAVGNVFPYGILDERRGLARILGDQQLMYVLQYPRVRFSSLNGSVCTRHAVTACRSSLLRLEPFHTAFTPHNFLAATSSSDYGGQAPKT